MDTKDKIIAKYKELVKFLHNCYPGFETSITAKKYQELAIFYDDLAELEAQLKEQEEAPKLCPNCKEDLDSWCACMRNTCIKCGKPVGNITFTVCDDCWEPFNKSQKP